MKAFRAPPAWPGSLALAIVLLCTGAAAALETKGLWVQIERRGWPVEYWPGQVVQQFNQFDSVVGRTVSEEAAAQLDAIRAMGVNTITIELRSADTNGNFVFPICNIDPALGFQWPQPTPTELANLTPFFDLIHSKGIRVILVLTNTHMEEMPRTNSQTWLGAILNVIKNHAALDFVVFNGTPRTVDTTGDGVPDACGTPAETPLYLGSSAVPANYVKWAIPFAMSLGMPASKLAAGTIVGNFFTDSQPPAGPDATDGHLWKPVAVMKSIFDSLAIPHDQRVYALSFYEHRKCSTAQHLPCTDADPPTWADQTLADVYATIGTGNGARVVAYEMGNLEPVQPSWTTSQSLTDLVAVLRKYGAGGGSFWRWTNVSNSEDTDPTRATPIKLRGVAFNYTSVLPTLVRAYKPPASTHDFNGDDYSDILWRHSSGAVALWLMKNGALGSLATFGTVAPNWQIVGQRDFDGDGKHDWLWRDTSTGALAIWFLAGASVAANTGVGTVPTNWSVAGTGDFNGDGKGDILWRDAGGATAVWLMNGGAVSQSAGLGAVDVSWSIAGAGDFNGDGNADVLWRHAGGDVAVWLMNGAQVSSVAPIANVPPTWVVVGTGDFNGDGKADLLWRDSSGTLAMWLMNGAQVTHSAVVDTVATSWTIAETGDFNGDGKADILWRHSSGATAIWLMNGTSVAQGASLATIGTDWTIQSVNVN